MQPELNIALIQGSIREGRFNDVVSRWAAKRLTGQGFRVSIVDPGDPAILPLQTGDMSAVAALRERLADIDGFVVVTPEYNHAAPGPLKTLIDAVKDEWAARPVGLISYGGISGGLRAVETLRPVFAELHAMTLRDTVSFAMPFDKFDENGELKHAKDAEAAGQAMTVFASGLAWWARALRAARDEQPYEQRAA